MSVLFVSTAVLAVGAGSGQAAGDDGEISVVVLGDSYSAGNGAGDYWPNDDCHRSWSNWASRYANFLRADGFLVNFGDLSQAPVLPGSVWMEQSKAGLRE